MFFVSSWMTLEESPGTERREVVALVGQDVDTSVAYCADVSRSKSAPPELGTWLPVRARVRL
jgi:hypothetical protein